MNALRRQSGVFRNGRQQIVAIGGGSMSAGETLTIDREIVRFTGIKRPRTLFVPTASDDRETYWHDFQRVYGERLKCQTDVLWLRENRPAASEMKRKIADADLIYVGGGNTLKMMMAWRRLGVDKLLTAAWKRGTVMAGTSAGANCWFRFGSSDSRKFTSPDNWSFIRVRGLGIVQATACPHYHAERREKTFREMIQTHGSVGIALDNNTALQIDGDRCRVLRSQSEAKAYRLWKKNGKVVREPLPPGGVEIPLEQLITP